MEHHFSFDSPHRRRKDFRIHLAFSWIAGMIFGILAGLSAEESILSLMRGILHVPVSIVGIACVTVVPFLVSAYAVFLSNFSLLLLICFVKAFLFSFGSFGVFQAFTSAGWLMRILLLFSDWTSLPILYWFFLRSLSPDHSVSFWEAIFLLCLIGLLGSIHYCIISPFLVGLIEI